MCLCLSVCPKQHDDISERDFKLTNPTGLKRSWEEGLRASLFKSIR